MGKQDNLSHKSHITSTYKRLEVVDRGDANKSLKNLIYIKALSKG